ncbi:MAG: protein translocase subunit SecF [Proteobacteria bacterium]|nr:protein translocase subunit SecF [Pseudomonadota bacterium]
MGGRRVGFAFSSALTLMAIFFFFHQGLAYGIDFKGGILMEVRAREGVADLALMRDKLGGLGLGEHDLQGFGQPSDAAIRIAQQPGGEAAQQRAVEKVRTALGPGFDYRRVEFVGPKVGDELVRAGIIAAVMALLGIMAYIWFRFEWQFALGGAATVFHDMITTVGLFSFTQMQFDLNTLAAILTIAGYSLNDTVVVYDRIREDLRKYKKMPLVELFNLALNETLSRTVLTSLTTMLALVALVMFGGEVISGFSIAMIWGVIVGTYSTCFISVPLLLYMNMRRQVEADDVQGSPAGGKTVP